METPVRINRRELYLSEDVGNAPVSIRVDRTLGRPRYSPQQTADRFWSKVDRRGPDECWLWLGGMNPNGYGAAWFDGRPHNAQRIAWMLSCGPIPAGKLVCHTCDVRRCCNPRHLYIGTHADNTRDMVVRGRHNRDGKRHVTTAQVIEIRRRYAAGGVTLTQLGDEHGVSPVCIHLIVARKTWKHVA